MKRPTLLIILILSAGQMYGQSLSLENCRSLARAAADNDARIENINQNAKANAQILKQLILPFAEGFGLYSYQSDVTDFDRLTDYQMTFQKQSKDQFHFGVIIQQNIYKGGEYINKRKLVDLERQIGLQELEQNMMELDNTVDELFFNCILAQKSIVIVSLQVEKLQMDLGNVQDLFSEGKAMRKDVLMVESMIIETEGRLAELKAEKEKCFALLSTLTGKEISPDSQLELPEGAELTTEVEEPSLILSELKLSKNNLYQKLALSEALPTLSLSALGFYGKWGLDLLNPDPTFNGIVGIKMEIPITQWRTQHYKKSLYRAQAAQINYSINDINRRRNMMYAEYDGQIRKYRALEDEATRLSTKYDEIAAELKSLVDSGDEARKEYLTAQNAAMQSKLNCELYRIERIKAIIARNRAIVSE
ncbi:MAG: TolC family protein [Bacteroidales bacterium]|nr:TolC family protein [Bacteroidales bacterium]